MKGIDNVLKYLGIGWSIVVVIAGVVFFAGGEWQKWQDIKNNYGNYATKAEVNTLRTDVAQAYATQNSLRSTENQLRSEFATKQEIIAISTLNTQTYAPIESVDARILGINQELSGIRTQVASVMSRPFVSTELSPADFLQFGTRVLLQTSNFFLFGDPSARSAELSVIIGGTRQEWALQRP